MNQPPNVVVCICDQLRSFEVGCYGNQVIRTPYIDHLAEEGVRFDTAITNNPVCMPARSCLMSGQYSRTCMGALTNHAATNPDGTVFMPEYPVRDRLHLRDETMPEAFRKLGYDTAVIGKWHIHPSPSTIGFDYSLYPRVHHRHTGQEFIENDGPGQVIDEYSVNFESDRVDAYLSSHRTKPFFLYYSISPPHMPLLDAPDEYLSMYNPEDIPLRPNVWIDEDLPFDERWFKIYLWDFLFYDQNLPHTRHLPEGFDLRRLIALYYGMTTWVDDMVGRLMRNLQRHGLSDNTVVLFVSDHGDNLGSHHRFNKGLLIEESIRIPMIFHSTERWSSRIVTDQVAQLIDVMPTLVTTCSGDVPSSVQGRDLSPTLTGERSCLDETDAIIETSGGQIGLRTPNQLAGIQLNDDLRGVSNSGRCLYDIDADPYEWNNLLDPQTSGATNPLIERLMRWNEKTPWLADRA